MLLDPFERTPEKLKRTLQDGQSIQNIVKVSSKDNNANKKQSNRQRKSRNRNKTNKRKYKTNDKRELVLVKDRSMDDSKMNQFNFWMFGMMFGMMIIGSMLEYQGYDLGVQYLLNTMTTWIQVIGHVIKIMMGELPWYLWPAPILWSILTIVSMNGRTFLHRIYPEDGNESLRPELRSIRRHKEKYWRRFQKKRSKFLQKFK